MNEEIAVAYIRALTGMIDRTVECFELVDEVKAGEVREGALLREVKRLNRRNNTLAEALATQKSYSESLFRALAKASLEGEDLRVQLAEWEATRTTGGLRRGCTPDWSPNWIAKLSKMPPPYTPKTEGKK